MRITRAAAKVEAKLMLAGKVLSATEYPHRTDQARANLLLDKGIAATPEEAADLVRLLSDWGGIAKRLDL